MPEFLRLLPPAEARRLLLSKMRGPMDAVEVVETSAALHRITAQDTAAPHPLPEFSRSTVDGFALNARDTFGASAALPAYLKLVGEIVMGSVPSFSVLPGTCGLIHTGGMLPKGADAVVMLEHVQAPSLPLPYPPAAASEIEIFKAVAPGENVIAAGEDVQAGETVIRQGTRLRPQEIGGLMALGVTKLQVVRKPRVAILSSGDEVVDPHSKPLPGQVRDVNGPSLCALVEELGAEPVYLGIVPDELPRAQAAASSALADSEMLIITAGSSASTRDHTAMVIGSLGKPGVLVHGVNVRPGKPTILGVCDGKPVIGLPGNPVSALVIARLFVLPAISSLLGLPDYQPIASMPARLTVNLPSQTGREDWWPVQLKRSEAQAPEWLADPIFSRSNLIFSLVSADGLIRISPEKNGLQAGELVEVELLR